MLIRALRHGIITTCTQYMNGKSWAPCSVGIGRAAGDEAGQTRRIRVAGRERRRLLMPDSKRDRLIVTSANEMTSNLMTVMIVIVMVMMMVMMAIR